MTTDAPNLGHTPPEHAGRDAVHVAVVPCVAWCDLAPGERVSLLRLDGFEPAAVPDTDGDAVGIVDPFRQGTVARRERFWLCLFPGTVTSLRHVWTHPAFAPKLPASKEAQL